MSFPDFAATADESGSPHVELAFTDFEARLVATRDGSIFVRQAGVGPALLLLHGFPQTSLMWRDIAPILARGHAVVCADLRGYGRSGRPPSSDDHAPYGKRAMAAELVEVMAVLGHSRFGVAGHDRGARVAYRLALDHAEAVDRVAVLDAVPTAVAWDHADARLALAFWPWSLLAQPAPLPERLLSADPAAVIDNALSEWGSPPETFPPEIRAAYVAALSDPAAVHAVCEEYRAGAGLDREHDASDRAAGRRLGQPLLALWSAEGGLNDWYRDLGGPLGVWRDWAPRATGHAVPGGHFFPEERPAETAAVLAAFFART